MPIKIHGLRSGDTTLSGVWTYHASRGCGGVCVQQIYNPYTAAPVAPVAPAMLATVEAGARAPPETRSCIMMYAQRHAVCYRLSSSRRCFVEERTVEYRAGYAGEYPLTKCSPIMSASSPVSSSLVRL